MSGDGHGPGSGADGDAFLARLREFEGQVLGPPRSAPDEVNQAMIRHWCEALGDENPVYLDPEAAARSVHGQVVAPLAMLQAWTMWGLAPRPSGGEADPQVRLHALLDEAGFTGVVATDSRQTYHRDLHLGDRLNAVTTIESVSPEKHTGLGVGHFVTTVTRYTDAAGAPVGDMLFRILKFRPGTGRTAEPGREVR